MPGHPPFLQKQGALFKAQPTPPPPPPIIVSDPADLKFFSHLPTRRVTYKRPKVVAKKPPQQLDKFGALPLAVGAVTEIPKAVAPILEKYHVGNQRMVTNQELKTLVDWMKSGGGDFLASRLPELRKVIVNSSVGALIKHAIPTSRAATQIALEQLGPFKPSGFALPLPLQYLMEAAVPGFRDPPPTG